MNRVTRVVRLTVDPGINAVNGAWSRIRRLVDFTRIWVTQFSLTSWGSRPVGVRRGGRAQYYGSVPELQNYLAQNEHGKKISPIRQMRINFRERWRFLWLRENQIGLGGGAGSSWRIFGVVRRWFSSGIVFCMWSVAYWILSRSFAALVGFIRHFLGPPVVWSFNRHGRRVVSDARWFAYYWNYAARATTWWYRRRFLSRIVLALRRGLGYLRQSLESREMWHYWHVSGQLFARHWYVRVSLVLSGWTWVLGERTLRFLLGWLRWVSVVGVVVLPIIIIRYGRVAGVFGRGVWDALAAGLHRGIGEVGGVAALISNSSISARVSVLRRAFRWIFLEERMTAGSGVANMARSVRWYADFADTLGVVGWTVCVTAAVGLSWLVAVWGLHVIGYGVARYGRSMYGWRAGLRLRAFYVVARGGWRSFLPSSITAVVTGVGREHLRQEELERGCESGSVFGNFMPFSNTAMNVVVWQNLFEFHRRSYAKLILRLTAHLLRESWVGKHAGEGVDEFDMRGYLFSRRYWRGYSRRRGHHTREEYWVRFRALRGLRLASEMRHRECVPVIVEGTGFDNRRCPELCVVDISQQELPAVPVASRFRRQGRLRHGVRWGGVSRRGGGGRRRHLVHSRHGRVFRVVLQNARGGSRYRYQSFCVFHFHRNRCKVRTPVVKTETCLRRLRGAGRYQFTWVHVRVRRPRRRMLKLRMPHRRRVAGRVRGGRRF